VFFILACVDLLHCMNVHMYACSHLTLAADKLLCSYCQRQFVKCSPTAVHYPHFVGSSERYISGSHVNMHWNFQILHVTLVAAVIFVSCCTQYTFHPPRSLQAPLSQISYILYPPPSLHSIILHLHHKHHTLPSPQVPLFTLVTQHHPPSSP
jgi:hypothetical protein